MSATFKAFGCICRSHVMDDIAHVSLESVRSVYPSLSRLQCIVELENFGSIINR